MGGTVADQFLTTTLISGSLRTLAGTGTTLSVLTKITIPALTVTAVIRRLTPEVTSSTTVTIPGAPATFDSIGWVMNADIVPLSDPGRLRAQTINVPVTARASAGAVGLYTFTAILYASGTEVGRGSFAGGALDTITAVAVVITVPVVLGSAVNIAANARLQLALFVGANNVAATAATVEFSTGNVSKVNSFTYDITASRTGTDPSTLPAESVVRVHAAQRFGADAPGLPVDTGRRVTALARFNAETITLIDSPSRSVEFRHPTVDALADLADVASRQVEFRRPTTDPVNLPTDTAARLASMTRVGTEEHPRPVDTAQKLVIYGRTVRYDFQPGDEPLIDPTRSLAGIIRDTGGGPLPGALVVLFRADDVRCGQATSGPAGEYEFLRNSYDTATYYVAAWVDGEPDVQAVTERGLVPV